MPASSRSLEVTNQYRRRVVGIRDRVVQTARREWPSIEGLDGTRWPERMAAVVAGAQTEAVRAAAGYLTAYLSTELGARQRAVAVDARRYSGVSRDGRPLVEAFQSPLIGVKAKIREAYQSPARIEEVTPDRAAAWLRGGTHGGVQQDRVNALADKIVDGTWDPDGGRIMIASDGFVFDGQHRLQAVVATGMSIDALVSRGFTNPSEFGKARALRMVSVDVDNAHRAAITDTIEADDRFTGWQRATAGTCGACMALSGTSGKRFNYHPGCQCTPQPVVTGAPNRFPLKTGIQMFETLTVEEQNARFGAEKAEAIRTGALSLIALVQVTKLATGEDDFITEKPLEAAE